MVVYIEKTTRDSDSIKPDDPFVSIVSMHKDLKPLTRAGSIDGLKLIDSSLDELDGGVFTVDIQSYTTSIGKIRYRFFKSGEEAIQARNGFIYATTKQVLQRFKSDPQSQYRKHVISFLRRYVAFLNDEIFVVKHVSDSGKVILVSGECYGRRQAAQVAAAHGGEVAWFH